MEGMARTLLPRQCSGYYRGFPMKPVDSPERGTSPERSPADGPAVPVPDYRPVERFWPYVDLPEQPTEDELAALNPELAEALFGRSPLPFSISVEFPRFEGADYARAVEMARAAPEYREHGAGAGFRHRARFYPEQALQLRDLFDIVGRLDASDVLIDDRPVPYARELWLPLLWFLIA